MWIILAGTGFFYSLIYQSFIQSFIHSFIHSFIQRSLFLINLFLRAHAAPLGRHRARLLRSFTNHSFIRLFIHSFIRSFNVRCSSSTHSFTNVTQLLHFGHLLRTHLLAYWPLFLSLLITFLTISYW